MPGGPERLWLKKPNTGLRKVIFKYDLPTRLQLFNIFKIYPEGGEIFTILGGSFCFPCLSAQSMQILRCYHLSWEIKDIRVGGLETFLITPGSVSKDFFVIHLHDG